MSETKQEIQEKKMTNISMAERRARTATDPKPEEMENIPGNEGDWNLPSRLEGGFLNDLDKRLDRLEKMATLEIKVKSGLESRIDALGFSIRTHIDLIKALGNRIKAIEHAPAIESDVCVESIPLKTAVIEWVDSKSGGDWEYLEITIPKVCIVKKV